MNMFVKWLEQVLLVVRVLIGKREVQDDQAQLLSIVVVIKLSIEVALTECN